MSLFQEGALGESSVTTCHCPMIQPDDDRTDDRPNRHTHEVTTDRRILLVLTQSVWPSSAVPSQRTAGGMTTDRRILLVLTQSVWPSSAVPSQDCGRDDDGQTKSVSFETICLAVEREILTDTQFVEISTALDDGQAIR
jgi:hypothetical protein